MTSAEGGPYLTLFMPLFSVIDAGNNLITNTSKVLGTIHKAANPNFLSTQEYKLTKMIDMGNQVLNNSQLAELHYRKGTVFMLSQKFEEAIKSYEKSQSLYPYFLYAFMTASAYQCAGNRKKAIEYYSISLGLYDEYQKGEKEAVTSITNWMKDKRDHILTGATKLRDGIASAFSNLIISPQSALKQSIHDTKDLDDNQIAMFNQWKIQERSISRSDVYTARGMLYLHITICDLKSAVRDFKSALMYWHEKPDCLDYNYQGSYAFNLSLAQYYAQDFNDAHQSITKAENFLNSFPGKINTNLKFKVLKLKYLIYQWIPWDSDSSRDTAICGAKQEAESYIPKNLKGIKLEECFELRFIPKSVLSTILQFVTYSDRVKLMRCNQHFYKIITETDAPILWRTMKFEIDPLTSEVTKHVCIPGSAVKIAKQVKRIIVDMKECKQMEQTISKRGFPLAEKYVEYFEIRNYASTSIDFCVEFLCKLENLRELKLVNVSTLSDDHVGKIISNSKGNLDSVSLVNCKLLTSEGVNNIKSTFKGKTFTYQQ